MNSFHKEEKVTYIPSTTVSTWCRRLVPSRSLSSYITPYFTYQKRTISSISGSLPICRRTLLYRPEPCGSPRQTIISRFMAFRYWPVPARVPPVPIGQNKLRGVKLFSSKWRRTSTGNKRVDFSTRLSPDLRSGPIVMSFEVTLVLHIQHG